MDVILGLLLALTVIAFVAGTTQFLVRKARWRRWVATLFSFCLPSMLFLFLGAIPMTEHQRVASDQSGQMALIVIPFVFAGLLILSALGTAVSLVLDKRRS